MGCLRTEPTRTNWSNLGPSLLTPRPGHAPFLARGVQMGNKAARSEWNDGESVICQITASAQVSVLASTMYTPLTVAVGAAASDEG